MTSLCSYPTYRGIRLEQVGVVFIPASYEQGNTERTHSTGGGKKYISVTSEWQDFILFFLACHNREGLHCESFLFTHPDCVYSCITEATLWTSCPVGMGSW